MKGNLSARLARIKAAGASGPAAARPAPIPSPTPPQPGVGSIESTLEPLLASGWSAMSSLVLRRRISAAWDSPSSIPGELSFLCPGSASVFPSWEALDRNRLLFFDLETTGLSGGAGTTIFLAAFGRMGGEEQLIITQYLLLDFPGEGEFLDLLLSELKTGDQVLCTYNGRTFDAQILKTRCLMNGIFPPELPHLDLVYPARRLWKTQLPSCSLSEIEARVLGLDRGDDLPGSEAPEAWFSFLRTGDSRRLAAICEHNLKDILGLATLLSRLARVAAFPLDAVAVDQTTLALSWIAGERSRALEGQGRALLERAAKTGDPRALYVLAREFSSEGRFEAARPLYAAVASMADLRPTLRAAACRALAIGAERRLKDPHLALEWTLRILELEELPDGARSEAEGRRDRILRRLDTISRVSRSLEP